MKTEEEIKQEPECISFDLDRIKEWQFHYKEKTYKLNVEEVLKLFELIKEGA